MRLIICEIHIIRIRKMSRISEELLSTDAFLHSNSFSFELGISYVSTLFSNLTTNLYIKGNLVLFCNENILLKSDAFDKNLELNILL